MSVLSSLLGSLTPTQLSTFSTAIGQASSTVTQAVESQEIELLNQIASDPANGGSALAQLTGIKGVPTAAVSLTSDAIGAFKAGDKVTAATNLSNAKSVILQQKLSSLSGLFGGLFG